MSDLWVRDFLAEAESGHAGRTLELVEAVRKERWAAKEAAALGMVSLKASLEREASAAGRNRLLRQWLAKYRDQVVPAWSHLGFPSPPKSGVSAECSPPTTGFLCPSFIPASSKIPSSPSGVVVLDFDQTLSTRHVGVFEDVSRITDRAFGGSQRVEMLRDLLSTLSQSVLIAVVSRNSRHVISKVLQHLDLKRFFAENLIFGFEDFGDEIPKSWVIQNRILSPFHLPASRVVFVDDDPGNVEEVNGKIPGIVTVKCPRFGLGQEECAKISELVPR